MHSELPTPPAPEAPQPTAQIVSYAQFLSAKARRDLDRLAAQVASHSYHEASAYHPPAT